MSINNVDAWYCTREDVQRALDATPTARSTQQIDRVIGQVSRQLEDDLGRIFYPLLTTRKFDWPQLPTVGSYPWRMWLNQYELISATTVTSGGKVIPASGYLLEPVNDGPPYNRIEVNLGTSAAFSSGPTWQQSLVIAGLFGYDDVQTSAGALATAMSDTTTARLDLTDSSQVGVGSILVCEAERGRVVARQQLDTLQDLTGNIDAKAATVAVPITDGTKVSQWEVITVGTERMLVTDVIGNTLTVRRAWDGTVLAAHSSGDSVFAGRRMVLGQRGDFGSTAATHTGATAVGVQRIVVRSLAVAEALNVLIGEEAGMQRRTGSGDSQSDVGPSLMDIRAEALNRWGRSARFRTI